MEFLFVCFNSLSQECAQQMSERYVWRYAFFNGGIPYEEIQFTIMIVITIIMIIIKIKM